MVKPTRRKVRKASSGSNSDTSPKQETKRNNLDEKVSFPTKSLMTAQIEQHETSPSSSDMWKVLMRIEDNTNSLINDFKALQRNYNELRASLEFLQAKIDDLSTSNSVLQTKMEAMEKANFELRENVSNMEAKLQESLMKNVLLEEKIHEINSKHDDLEQYTRKYNLEMDGIPEVHGEDLEDVVIKLARSIDADVGPDDIDIVHRFKKGKRQPNPIIVPFNNYYSKKEMYYGRRKLRKVNVRHISGAEKIYINENLTSQRAALFKKVRDKKRLRQGWKVWTTDGKIFVKPDSSLDYITRINSVEDLEKL